PALTGCARPCGRRRISSVLRRRWRYRAPSSLALPQRDAHRLADAQVLGPFRSRFDQEHELRALIHAVDHRRREFRGAGDEADLGGDVALAAVTRDGDGVAEFELGQRRFVDEEPHLQVAGGQQRENRLARRDQLAPTVIDLLDGTGDGAEYSAPGEPRLRRVEPRL